MHDPGDSNEFKVHWVYVYMESVFYTKNTTVSKLQLHVLYYN